MKPDSDAKRAVETAPAPATPNPMAEALQYETRLTAYVFDADANEYSQATLSFVPDPAGETLLAWKDTRSPPTITPRGQWRIFAGQPNPADPAHFTIAYDIDGAPGVIDGRLNDGGRVMLTPRIG